MIVLITNSAIWKMSKLINFITKRLSYVNEEKLRFEYESKQRLDSLNKRNIDLRAENENLQLNFNDK